jgi:hypothetical protein
MARRVAIVILDRSAAGDNEAALANLRQGGLGVGRNLGLVAEVRLLSSGVNSRLQPPEPANRRI